MLGWIVRTALLNGIPGYVADLEAATLDDVRAFFETFYAPNNAVLTVAGEEIGNIGATTENLSFISSPRNVVVNAVAPAVQAEIDALTLAGVNKIILISHLQSVLEDQALAGELEGVDVMIAGGTEFGTTPTAMAGFIAAKAMSTRNDDPRSASRPFDRDRDGFVLSDGAGALVVEELEHARARGAPIYAELIGFGMSGDAHHITAPLEDGEGARRCMVNALEDAGIAPEDVDYVNAHGTSTQLGDVAETIAIKATFGDHASNLAVSSTKSMTGHLLGAAGAVEAIFSVLALRDQVIPPTINLQEPGEGCDLDYVPNEARPARIEVCLNNAFGFGGHNVSLLFSSV